MKKNQRGMCPAELGCPSYVNGKCFLARVLNAPPTKTCQYCDRNFRQCMFLQYSLIALGLIVFLLAISFLLDGKITESAAIAVFLPVIVYGFFFRRSIEKIIEADFSEKKAKLELEELTSRLEEKVNAQTRNLEEKNQDLIKLLIMRSQFIDLASHELRTSVSVIKNIIEMMESGDYDKMGREERSRQIHNAFEKSVRLGQIISDILISSELDAAGLKVDGKNVQEIRLEDIIERAVNDISFEAAQKKIVLDWEKPKEELPLLIGNEHYLYHAIFNLIDNAVKYTPPLGNAKEEKARRALAGRVKIRLEKQGDELVFSVQDNGIGIPKGEIGELFNKFSRASNARAMYSDGSGLGLFTAKEIIEGHGGRVKVESEMGKGSVFKIFLPSMK